MTDFFTRLAERTLGLTPRIQPLLASRFAPAPVTPVFFDTLDEVRASAPEPPADPTQTPTALSREGPVSTQDQISSSAATEMHAISRTSQSRTTQSSSRATELSARTAQSSHAPDETIRPDAWSAERGAAVPSVKMLQGPPIQPMRAPPVARLEPRRQSAIARSLPAPSVVVAVERTNDPVQHDEQTQAAPLSFAAVSQEQSEASKDERESLVRSIVGGAVRHAEAVRPQPPALVSHEESFPRSNDSGPPIVRVTIGRIEVRAIQPPAPPVPRAIPPAPKLSLEEYLGRGGRP
jgi:hypothetical protein